MIASTVPLRAALYLRVSTTRLALEGDGTTGQMGVKNIVSYLDSRRIFKIGLSIKTTLVGSILTALALIWTAFKSGQPRRPPDSPRPPTPPAPKSADFRLWQEICYLRNSTSAFAYILFPARPRRRKKCPEIAELPKGVGQHHHRIKYYTSH